MEGKDHDRRRHHPTGLPVTVDVGGATATFVLAEERQGEQRRREQVRAEREAQERRDQAATVNFSFNLKGAFQAQLAAYGLTNADAKKVAVSVPVTLTAGPGEYATDQAFTYKATAGEEGNGEELLTRSRARHAGSFVNRCRWVQVPQPRRSGFNRVRYPSSPAGSACSAWSPAF